ncbi:MAG: DEAD/DEAH box helicase [Patescibacteria group bacterium]|nr:DEAD/DEAH box helicase [Patescibacteria group bacterium]
MPGDNQNLAQTKYSIAQLRKTHARAGMKWENEEDERLKKAYGAFRSGGQQNFQEFAQGLAKQFERTFVSIQARLAKYFSDVPGWDYGRDKMREEAKKKETVKIFTREADELLAKEYGKYLDAKQETYMAFLRRLSRQLGNIKGELISFRLQEIAGTVTKYGREDVFYQGTAAGGKIKIEKEVPDCDFSGNPPALQALDLMEHTGQNLFLTGEAGTGKSTLLSYFRAATGKNVVVLAPTGVAALNVDGQTIHSFCAFGPDITASKVKKLRPGSPKLSLLQKLQMVIIDEISMVRADLLDCLEKFLRINGPLPDRPFGGIQIVFIGDLHQLPPVEKDFQANDFRLIKEYQSAYFFNARSFKAARFEYIKLSQVYRQKEQVFLDVLNAVRNNAVTQEHLSILNERSETAGTRFSFEKYAIYLTPTNRRAKQVNDFFLQRLPGELKSYQGQAFGRFENRELPTDLHLQIKIGSQVMMLNNDRKKRWVNGTMGTITGIESGNNNEPYYDYDAYKESGSLNGEAVPGTISSDTIIIELETGETVYVKPYTWEMYQFVLDKQTQKVDSKTVGTFTQYPFKLAWAVTIHKAQGKTFDKVFIDLAAGTFTHGQLYVALSRCRTLQGLFLKRPVCQEDIILDGRILEFLKSLEN